MLASLLLALSLLGLAPSADCRKIEDRDRRGFDDLSPILIDVDGDGQPDRITPRVYKVREKGRPRGDKRRERHWIAFDLKTSRGRTTRSFFKYRYGTDEADYWAYAVVPCDADEDGRADLVFHAGDDTSAETVILRNTGRGFVVHSRGTTKVGGP